MFKIDSDKKRTIIFILTKIKQRGDLKKRIPHVCRYNLCSPKNVLKFLSPVQCSRFTYNPNVYVCSYQQIHFCFDSNCSFSYTNKKSEKFCPVTGQAHQKMIGDIVIQNKRNRIPSKQYCNIPQEERILETHKHTMTMKNRALELDKYYNNLIFRDNDDKERTISDGNNITVQFIKKREKNIKYREVIDVEKDVIKVLTLKEPLLNNASTILLISYKLYNFVNYNLNLVDLLLSTEKLKLSKHFEDYKNLVRNAEDILIRILPGIYRIKKNWREIETLQTIAYTHAMTYIKKCMQNKTLLNGFKLITLLDFDSKWKSRHTLVNWVTFEKWVYFLEVILRSYMFCERCGQINEGKKSLAPVKHILGVMYTLKKGYSKKVGPVTFKLIPKDNYLNQYGVLLEENKLSSYVERYARKWVNEGEDTFQKFLDKGFEIMTDVEIRKIIFPF